MQGSHTFFPNDFPKLFQDFSRIFNPISRPIKQSFRAIMSLLLLCAMPKDRQCSKNKAQNGIIPFQISNQILCYLEHCSLEIQDSLWHPYYFSFFIYNCPLPCICPIYEFKGNEGCINVFLFTRSVAKNIHEQIFFQDL